MNSVNRRTWLVAAIVALSATARAEYRYALIVKTDAWSDTRSTVAALREQGFQCSEATWESERDAREGLSRFLSGTAVNSTCLVVFRGEVTTVESKSKEHRGQKGPGLHCCGATPFPLVDLLHAMDTIGGSQVNVVHLDAPGSIETLKSAVPGGCLVTTGPVTSVVGTLKTNDLLGDEPRTALSPPGKFVPGRKLGDEWVNGRGMVFRWCPAGSFTDGTGETVAIDDGFWLMKYEWTRGQILGKGDLRNSPGHHNLHALGGYGLREMPRVLKRLNDEERNAGRLPEDYDYALPTEAQWEHAARAGSETNYCFGDDVERLPAFGNFADKSYRDTGDVYSNYGHRTLDDGEAGVARVGQYEPNAWGFHDVHGNVSEFCENKACRGGSWISAAKSCRFDFRDGPWGHSVGRYQGYRFVIRRVITK